MSKLVARSFKGLGLDLRELDIDNSRPDGNYLDDKLAGGIYTCISGDGRLYFGIEPSFPWKQSPANDAPESEDAAKHMVASCLLKYLAEERSRLEKNPDEYEDVLEDELPTEDELISKVRYIDDCWNELW